MLEQLVSQLTNPVANVTWFPITSVGFSQLKESGQFVYITGTPLAGRFSSCLKCEHNELRAVC